ncbi:MAG: HAD-IIIA family hydrolase [Spirochaetota bacterium]
MRAFTAYIIAGDAGGFFAPMADVAGRPFLAWQLEWLCRHSVTDVVVAGNIDVIREHFGDGGNIGMRLRYAPSNGLSFAGSFFSAAALYPCEAYLLLSGKSFFNIDLTWFMRFAYERGECSAAVKYLPDIPLGPIALDDGFRIVRPDRSHDIFVEGYHYGGVYAGRFASLVRPSQAPHADGDLSPAVCGIPFGDRFIDADSGYERLAADPSAYFSAKKSSAIFLDRDGILVEDTGYLASTRDVRIIDEAVLLVRRANERGRKVIVLTNQAGVAKGKFSEADVTALNRYIGDGFQKRGACIDGWYYCPTHPSASVASYRRESLQRKPSPGMLLLACDDHAIDATGALMIGDKDSDALSLPYIRTHLLQGAYPITRRDNLSTWDRAMRAVGD